MFDVLRVQKEFVEIECDKKLFGVSIEIFEGDLMCMCGIINGFVGIFYEGGIFVVDI